jgi:hypothetical protein
MKESANTEAPSHFLVVRRRYGKTEADMSEDEQLLCESSVQDIQGIKVAINNYVNSIYKTDDPARSITIATSVKPGKNQYGKPAVETWWGGPIDEIKKPFVAILRRDFDKRLRLSSTKLSTQTVFPVGKLEVVNPNTFKWAKDHIIVATIPKIEEPATDDSYDENVMSDPSYYPKGDPWNKKTYEEQLEDTEMKEALTEDDVAGILNQMVSNTENTTSTLTGETLQLLCNNPVLEYKIGTIISVTTSNQQNLFKEKKQLYKITATDSQGKPTAAELITDIKEGREQQILEAYANIRDYYYELQKEEQ